MKLRGAVIGLFLLVSFVFAINFISGSVNVCQNWDEYSQSQRCWVYLSNPSLQTPSIYQMVEYPTLQTDKYNLLPVPPQNFPSYYSPSNPMNNYFFVKYITVYEKELERGMKRLDYLFYPNGSENKPDSFELWESDMINFEFNSTYDNSTVSTLSPGGSNPQPNTFYQRNVTYYPGDKQGDSPGEVTYSYDSFLVPFLNDNPVRNISESGTNAKFNCYNSYGEEICLVTWYPSIQDINKSNKYCLNDFSKCLQSSNYKGEGLYEFYLVPTFDEPLVGNNVVFKDFNYYENFLTGGGQYSFPLNYTPLASRHVIFMNVTKGPYLDDVSFNWSSNKNGNDILRETTLDFKNQNSPYYQQNQTVYLDFSGFPSYYYYKGFPETALYSTLLEVQIFYMEENNLGDNEGATTAEYKYLDSIYSVNLSMPNVIVPWNITYSHLIAAGDKYETKLYAKVITPIDEKEFFGSNPSTGNVLGHELIVYSVQGSNPPQTSLENLTSEWQNTNGGSITSFQANFTTGVSNIVQIKVPAGTATTQTIFPDFYNETQVQVEIYELDNCDDKLYCPPEVSGIPQSSSDFIKSISGTVDRNGELSVNWEITEEDVLKAGLEEAYEFYYKIVTPVETKTFQDKILNLTIWEAPETIDLTYAEGEWRSISTNTEITFFKFNAEKPSNEVVLYVSNIDAPAGSTVKFEIYEKDGFPNPDDDIRVKTNALTATFDHSTKIAYATWNITPEDIDNAKNCVGLICDNGPWEFYFKVIVESSTEKKEKRFNNELLEVEETFLACNSISMCSDYKEQSYCDLDTCSVANQSVPPQLKVDCDSVNCFCEWISAQERCQFKWKVDGVGSCAYSEGDLEGDTCDDDGYLTYSWNAVWSWTGNSYTSQQACESANSVGTCVQSGIYWYYDPNKDSEKCVDISGAFLCPAKAKLPGFNWINLLIALLVLAIVYYFLINKKANSKKKAISSKKKK